MSPRAGAYARDRYNRALRRYRRRHLPEVITLVSFALGGSLLIAVLRGLDWWSYVIGVFAGGLITLAITVRDEPPEFIAKWGPRCPGRGKDGA